MVTLDQLRVDAAEFLASRSAVELVAMGTAATVLVLSAWFLFWVASRRPPIKYGPKWHWFIGSTMEFIENFPRIHEWIFECTRDYGEFKHAWGGSMLAVGQFGSGMICLVTPEEVKHVLKDNFSNYEKGALVANTLQEFLGDGIFTSDGPRWKVHRKVAVHMFSKNLMVDGTEVALAQAKKLVSLLDAKAATGEEVDIQPAFYAFTMDTFCSIAFGIELNSQDKVHPFATAFDCVQELSALRLSKPFWQAERFFGSKAERTITAQVKVIDEFASRVIESKRRVLKEKGQALGIDLVTRFLDNAAKRNETLSTPDLRDIVLNFIIAGRDTTASALSWAIYELCRNPEIGDIVRAELKRCLPDGRSILELSKEEAFEVLSTGLVETKAVVMEVLRLHPSVAVDIKSSVKDDVLPTGIKVPAKCAIVYAPHAMGRNPLIWPDPERFDHTRFMSKNDTAAADGNDDADAAADDSNAATGGGGGGKRAKPRRVSVYKPTAVSDYKYPVFNAGPRLCLGRPLAILEIQLMLCALVQRFDFVPSRPHTPKAKVTVVAANENGVPVRLTRRK